MKQSNFNSGRSWKLWPMENSTMNAGRHGGIRNHGRAILSDEKNTKHAMVHLDAEDTERATGWFRDPRFKAAVERAVATHPDKSGLLQK